MDDMLEHARSVAAGVMGGEKADCLYESVCMPLNTTGGRPMVIAPVLIRGAAATAALAAAEGGTGANGAAASIPGSRDPSAAAIVIEAGTATHMLALDGGGGGGTGGGGTGGGGSSRPIEVPLDALNHAPLSLPLAPLEAELNRYLLDIQLKHAMVLDAIGQRVVPHSLALVAAPMTASAGGVAEWGGVGDAQSLVERLNSSYRANLQQEAGEKRIAIAALVSAPPASSKSTLISMVATHAVGARVKAGAFGLIPIVIRATHLARLMRAHPLAFAASWNYVDAFSSLVYGASSTRHAMLRQLLISRRCMLLIDGLDEGGVTAQGDGHGLRSIAAHVLEDLVLQGHAVVATASSEEVLTGAESSSSSGEAGGSDTPAAAGQVAASTRNLWGHLAVSSLSDDQQSAMIKQRLAGAPKLAAQVQRFVDTAMYVSGKAAVQASPQASPLLLSAVIALHQRSSSDGAVDSEGAEAAEGGGFPTSVTGFLNLAIDAMLSRVDVAERAGPADAVFVLEQRAILEALAIVAHASGRSGRDVREAELVGHLEGRTELQGVWLIMRRKLALGSLPLLSVLCAKPLSLSISHISLQEHLATRAICNGRWPANMPKPWAWSEWWRGIAKLGCEDDELRAPFGTALLVACKTQDLVIEHVSGHAPTVADALLAMVRQAHAAGSRIRIKVASKKDAVEAAKAPDEHGPRPKGELSLASSELGGLPANGFAVLVALLAAEPGTSALNLAKNGLGPTHAHAVVEGASRGGRSAVERLQLDRNVFGSDGASQLCEALMPSSCERIVDLDLSQNAIGSEAGHPLANLLRANRLHRLVLTTNPIFGGEASDDSRAADGPSSRPRDPFSSGQLAQPPPTLRQAPPTPQQREAFKAFTSALGTASSLKELHLRAVGLDENTGGALGDALGNNRALESLSLWRNALGGKGGKALFAGLRMNTSLTLLDMRSNGLNDDAGFAIASHLTTAKGSRLSQLALSDNELGSESGRAIAKAWSDNAILAVLDVRGNRLDAETVKQLKSARTSAARKRKEGSTPVELLADE